MKKILIAIIAVALIAGIVVYNKVSKRNAANKKQNLKLEYANLCTKHLQAFFPLLTDKEVVAITNCVLNKEDENFCKNKSEIEISSDLKNQIMACIKELKLNVINK